MKSQAFVSICFDDGRESAVRIGAAILEQNGARGTYYIITSRVGTTNAHGAYAAWDDLRKIAKKGHEIGNHTHSHIREWIDWPYEQKVNDIKEANDHYHDNDLPIPETFVYPFGFYTAELIDAVKHSTLNAISAARTIERGVNTAASDPFLLRSFCVEREHTIEDIEKEIVSAVKQNGWLILTFHHLDDKTYLSTPPVLFEEIVRRICEKKISIVTVREGVTYMNTLTNI